MKARRMLWGLAGAILGCLQAREFVNLDFNHPDLSRVVCWGVYGWHVPAEDALPGWSWEWEGGWAPVFPPWLMSLQGTSSPGLIGFWLWATIDDGSFAFCSREEWGGSVPPTLPTLYLYQSGVVPLYAAQLLVSGWHGPLADPIIMLINGEAQPITGSQAVDVSRFAGQEVVLEFVFPGGPNQSHQLDIYGFTGIPGAPAPGLPGDRGGEEGVGDEVRLSDGGQAGVGGYNVGGYGVGGSKALEIELAPKLILRGEIGLARQVLWTDLLGDTNVWMGLRTVVMGGDPWVIGDPSAPRWDRRRYATVAPDGPVPVPPADFVWIPPGEFLMGSPDTEVDRLGDEGPQRLVTVARGFFLCAHEVTQGEYLATTGRNPSYFTGDLNRPVEMVDAWEAVRYCESLTARERAAGRLRAGWGYRLPTEVEWEYAARAGTTNRFSYGDDPGYAELGEHGWFRGNSGGTTHPVATKRPNPWGLYDMHGNVWERCNGGSRGGSWIGYARYCRSASRFGAHWYHYSVNLGFRVALALNAEIPTALGAVGEAAVVNGQVTGVRVTEGGQGYARPPAVILNGGGGSGALAQAFLNQGQVSRIEVPDAGGGYMSPPTVWIAAPDLVVSNFVEVQRIPRLTLHGVAGSTHRLECAPTLGDPQGWTVLTNVVLTNRPVQFDDLSAGPDGQRYYRLGPAGGER